MIAAWNARARALNMDVPYHIREDSLKRLMMLGMTAVFLTGAAAHAQDSPVQLGATAGLAVTTLVGDDVEDADSRTSLFGGATLVFHAPMSMIGFETGVHYVAKGAKSTMDGGDAVLDLTYIEVPLLVRIAMDLQGSSIRPVLLLGGAVGINQDCEVELTSGGTTVRLDCDDPIFDGSVDIRKVDVGVSAGLGVDIPVGARMVAAPAIRYTRGLLDIGDSDDSTDARNSAIQIGLTLRITL